ncbi:MAG: formylglycine-generating enzyme family protein [Gammaproteobacteria bacterium]|nr:formylglycine-generating enzyme family protein [Gammaproteobacteria bacterium]
MQIREHKVFPTEFPEPWASDWGEDDYGIFMGFTYKGVRQDFRWIEPGTFLMGSPKDEPERGDDETQHEVTLTKGYWLADTTVTQALWEAVMGENPSDFKGANRPVEKVNWNDAQAFISKMNGMKAELRLCLPTEAQWEYACRAGTTTRYAFGDELTKEQANFNASGTVEVASYFPNDWGLHEMHGNVWEWCQDWYGSYPAQPVVDPQGAESGAGRVLRGGSWILNGGSCRSASRHRFDPASRFLDSYGFRLARGL